MEDRVLRNEEYFKKVDNLTLENEEMFKKHCHLNEIMRYSTFLPKSCSMELNEFVTHFLIYENNYSKDELNNFQIREIEYINNDLSKIIDIDSEEAKKNEEAREKLLRLEQKKARSQGMVSAIIILYLTSLLGILAASALLLIR